MARGTGGVKRVGGEEMLLTSTFNGIKAIVRKGALIPAPGRAVSFQYLAPGCTLFHSAVIKDRPLSGNRKLPTTWQRAAGAALQQRPSRICCLMAQGLLAWPYVSNPMFVSEFRSSVLNLCLIYPA